VPDPKPGDPGKTDPFR